MNHSINAKPLNDDVKMMRFEAGTGSNQHFTHERIEASMAALGFSKYEMQAITFGNWLRDYSQLIDPKLVRAIDAPKNFPKVISRQGLTDIVDVLAIRKFSALRERKPEAFTVTKEKLGVYRPSQHIDNPKVENPLPADPTTIDPDFEPWTLPGHPMLGVDWDTSMKRYIHRSMAVMLQDLGAAVFHGRSEEGLRRLGAGLHILEDYFAHSNFVELSLIKVGFNVLPWTVRANCKWGLPVVTGMFGPSDVIASLAKPVADLLAPKIDWSFVPSTPGYRSDTEKMMLILLREKDDITDFAALEGYLKLRDRWSAIPGSAVVEFYAWLYSTPARLLGNAYGSMFKAVMTLIGNSIDDAQSLITGDPNTDGSVDVSHSQLSKDHADHPLHRIAATLASMAVREVGRAMMDTWRGAPEAADPIAVALSYLKHPQDTGWQDAIVQAEALERPENIRKAASKAALDQINARLQQGHVQDFQRLAEEGYWAHRNRPDSIKDFVEKP